MEEKNDTKLSQEPTILSIPEITDRITEAIKTSPLYLDNLDTLPRPQLLTLIYLKKNLSYFLDETPLQFVYPDGHVEPGKPLKTDIFYVLQSDIEFFLTEILFEQNNDNSLLRNIKRGLENNALRLPSYFPYLKTENITKKIELMNKMLNNYWQYKTIGLIDFHVRIESNHLLKLDDFEEMTKAHIYFDEYIKAKHEIIEDELHKLTTKQLGLIEQISTFNKLHIGTDGKIHIKDMTKFSIHLKYDTHLKAFEYTYYYKKILLEVPIELKEKESFLSVKSSEILSGYMNKYKQIRDIALDHDYPRLILARDVKIDYTLNKAGQAAIRETQRRIKDVFNLPKPLISYSDSTHKLWLNVELTVHYGSFNSNIGVNTKQKLIKQSGNGCSKVRNVNPKDKNN